MIEVATRHVAVNKCNFCETPLNNAERGIEHIVKEDLYIRKSKGNPFCFRQKQPPVLSSVKLTLIQTAFSLLHR
jgi:hypothetical protein